MHMRKLLSITLSVLCTVCVAAAPAPQTPDTGQSSDVAKTTIEADSTQEILFYFVPKVSMFFYGGNEKPIEEAGKMIEQHRSEIESGEMFISVNGYSSSFITEYSNYKMAKVRSNQVKSYYITNLGMKEEYYITDGDMEAIRERVDHVKGVTDTWTISGTILAPKGDFETYVSCGTWDMQYANQTEMKRGKYFTREDFYAGNKVGVISDQDAIRLFGTDDVVGMTVEVTLYNITQEVTLIGVCVLRVLWVCFIFPLDPTMENLMLSYPVTWIITSLANGAYLYWICRKLFRSGRTSCAVSAVHGT